MALDFRSMAMPLTDENDVLARIMRPDAGPLPMPDQLIENEPAPRFMPMQQPGGSFLDQLALAIGRTGGLQPDRTASPRSQALQSLVGGLARGFAGARTADMQERQTTQDSLREQTRQRNARAIAENERVRQEKRADNADMRKRKRDLEDFYAKERGKALMEQQAKDRERAAEEAGYLKVPSWLSRAVHGDDRIAGQRVSDDRYRLLVNEAGTRSDINRPRGGGSGVFGGLYGQVDADAIAEAIYSGNQSPLMISQIGRPAGAAVASILQKKYGFDLQRAQLDAQSAQTLYRTLNTGLQQRLRQATFNAGHQVDLVEKSAMDVERQMPRLPAEMANKGLGWLAANGALGPEASQAMTNLRGQISVLQSELSNVFQGGGVPTDESKRMAQHVINPDMSPANLRAAIYTVRREIANRLWSFEQAGTASPSNAPGNPQEGSFRIGPVEIRTAGRNNSRGSDWFEENAPRGKK